MLEVGVLLLGGRSDIGDEGDLVNIVGARGTGGDLRGVTRRMVGVVDMSWTSSPICWLP